MQFLQGFDGLFLPLVLVESVHALGHATRPSPAPFAQSTLTRVPKSTESHASPLAQVVHCGCQNVFDLPSTVLAAEALDEPLDDNIWALILIGFAHPLSPVMVSWFTLGREFVFSALEIFQYRCSKFAAPEPTDRKN